MLAVFLMFSARGVEAACGQIGTNTVLTDNFAGCIEITENNITLDCAGHSIIGSGTDKGITLDAKTGVTIQNCNIKDFDYGLYLSGIGVIGESNNKFTNLNIISNDIYGIFMMFTDKNIFTDIHIEKSPQGIFTYEVNYNTFDNLYLYKNSNHGMYVYTSSNNEIINSNAEGNGNGETTDYIIYILENSDNNIIRDNEFDDSNSALAVNIEGSTGNQIYNNKFDEDAIGDDSVGNYWYNQATNRGNYWGEYDGEDTDRDGIGDTGTVPYPSSGFDSYPLVDCTIVDADDKCSISDDLICGTGEFSKYVQTCEQKQNGCYYWENNVECVYLCEDGACVPPPCTNECIPDNYPTCEDGNAVSCEQQADTCYDKIVEDCKDFGCEGNNCIKPFETDTCGTITEDTILSENVIANTAGACFTVKADDIIFDCNGKSITNQKTNKGYAVSIKGELQNPIEDVTIRNCDISEFKYAITISGKSNHDRNKNIDILNNNLINNYYYGIKMRYNDGGTVSENNIESINYYGIRIEDSDEQNVIDNNLRNNKYGIYLLRGDENNILRNTIENNRYGIRGSYSHQNEIYYNSFLDNNYQQYLFRSENNWYNQNKLEGNFWSNYGGFDNGAGNGKHAIAGDSVGDTGLTGTWSEKFDYYPILGAPDCNNECIPNDYPTCDSDVSTICEIQSDGCYDIIEETCEYGCGNDNYCIPCVDTCSPASYPMCSNDFTAALTCEMQTDGCYAEMGDDCTNDCEDGACNSVEVYDKEIYKSKVKRRGSGTLVTYDTSDFDDPIRVSYKYLYYTTQNNTQWAYIYTLVDGRYKNIKHFKTPEGDDYNHKWDYRTRSFTISTPGDELKFRYRNGDQGVAITDVKIEEI
jgi:parallel beta-helix repeat protein